MRNLIVLILVSFFSNQLTFSQDKKVYNTVVFEKNMPHEVLNSNPPQKDLQFELYGSALFKNSFNEKILQNKMVISCRNDNKNAQRIYLSLSPEADFDFLKSLFQNAGVEYVSVEDTIIPINSWYAFSPEQIRRLWELNHTIINIEGKRQWVLQNPAQLEKAKQNGWWEDNTKLLENAIREKKNYVRQIIK
jgi:hypothetical protein